MNNRNDFSALLMVQVIIILLKLANVSPVSSWNWVWVLSFIWVPFGVGLVALIFLRGKLKKQSII
jgi:hypothetical protein